MERVIEIEKGKDRDREIYRKKEKHKDRQSKFVNCKQIANLQIPCKFGPNCSQSDCPYRHDSKFQSSIITDSLSRSKSKIQERDGYPKGSDMIASEDSQFEVSFLPPRSYGNCKDKGGDKEDDSYSRILTSYLMDSESYHVQRDKIGKKLRI
jgi:hypothetical protein